MVVCAQQNKENARCCVSACSIGSDVFSMERDTRNSDWQSASVVSICHDLEEPVPHRKHTIYRHVRVIERIEAADAFERKQRQAFNP